VRVADGEEPDDLRSKRLKLDQPSGFVSRSAGMSSVDTYMGVIRPWA
jgi:hypothetical protein